MTNERSASRLYEELLDLRGDPLFLVMEKINKCAQRAKTTRAKTILYELYDDFCEYVRRLRAKERV